MNRLKVLLILVVMKTCASYRILAVFPYNGRSHHIYFSALVEELAVRKHDVTVINYFPVKNLPNLKQITLKSPDDPNESDKVNMEIHMNSASQSIFGDFFKAIDSARAFEYLANSNCKKLVDNEEIRGIINSATKYDVLIVEQFVTDCHLALAHRLQAPMVGMAAHVLMPWTYSRLGAPNNPAFVPNHFIGFRPKPDIWDRLKSFAINAYLNCYYQYIIQKNDYETVRSVYPDTPDLETIGKNLSAILLNQYFPLTGSRLHGRNVIEVGGLHITDAALTLNDEELSFFLNNSRNGVVYVSFGSTAKNFPRKVLEEIVKVIQKSEKNFVWKVDDDLKLDVPKNALLRSWLPQPAILCHPNVQAFITHSGMLSSSEAMHCGVPIVSIPLFGDQFANAASAIEVGLGVKVDIMGLDEKILSEALDTVLQPGYRTRAKQLSAQWRDRPLSPMDNAIYWIEYVARHRGVSLKPPSVDLPFYQYLMLDILAVVFGSFVLIFFILIRILKLFVDLLRVGKETKKSVAGKKKRT